ncbi:MAG: hypothetical protein E7A62_09415, partial [Actinomycetaceae bacterium]|nr:hypothetical protein [Actinomycetaceae bacterium]MDU0971190.1 hypothetical protein [Actinomycetaceae bacterium]
MRHLLAPPLRDPEVRPGMNVIKKGHVHGSSPVNSLWQAGCEPCRKEAVMPDFVMDPRVLTPDQMR